MPESIDTATDRSAEAIQDALARMTRRGYDAPRGDWIQNPLPIRLSDSDN